MNQLDAYDLLVIGGGPAGEHAAIAATKLGKSAAIIEKRTVVGGVCTNTGTIPSKSLREAILFLSGYRKHAIYGDAFRVKPTIDVADLLKYVHAVVSHELEVQRKHLDHHGVRVINGTARFAGPGELEITFEDGRKAARLRGERIIIATGTRPRMDPHVPFDGRQVLSSDDIINLDRLPANLAVMGGGVIGCEYATMFATLGVEVTLIERGDRLLGFLDKEIAEALMAHMRDAGITIRMGEKVESVKVIQKDGGGGGTGGTGHVEIRLTSGKTVKAEKALYAIGRVANTEMLNLEAAGLKTDDAGRLEVDAHYRTSVDHIYAVGDVVGFPSLASTSMEQGRVAAHYAFGEETEMAPQHFPYGIYTIPEISYVGENEEKLRKDGVDYEIGRADYKEVARAMIIGDPRGMFKLFFERDTKKLLGVHIIGEDASDLVNIGQAVKTLGGTIDYFVDSVFNYPTLAEGYKLAAYDGLERMAGKLAGTGRTS